eukprot:scaffold2136_cov170-Ochromonas_danica.AAC.1
MSNIILDVPSISSYGSSVTSPSRSSGHHHHHNHHPTHLSPPPPSATTTSTSIAAEATTTTADNSLSPSRRSPSPNKLQRLINEGKIHTESSSYQSAVSKLYESAWKFDRHQEDIFVKGLDNRDLSIDQFKQILYVGMNCKLSHDEFQAILPLIQNDVAGGGGGGGGVDGSEFLLWFFRMRFDHRARYLTERIVYDKKRYESYLKEEKDSLFKSPSSTATTTTTTTATAAKPSVTLVMDYTPEDLHNAEEKMKEAAVRYDRLMPGASPLDGFNVESLDSMEFRDTIRSVFHVKLTLPELSAYILTYHNEEKNYRVNCANFLLNFFRNGFQEKSRRLKELWKKRKDKEELLKKEKLEKEKILEKKNAMQVNFHFTEEEKENAVLKLRRAAKLYDKTTPGAMSMKAFEVKEMPPHVFKEQLRRIFNLKVTPAEMGALMSVFDVNGDGVITCEEFTKVFINMGFEEREKELKAYRQQQQLQLQKQRKLEKEVQQAKDHLNATKVAYNYTEEEWETAMFKLKEAAWRFDRTMTGAPSLEAFNQLTMTVYEFKDQLKRIFYLNTTPQELGAIMKYFDPEESGQINCSNFLKKFLRLGYEERMERKREYRLYEEQMARQRKEREEAKLTALQQKQNIVLANAADATFTEQ